MNWKIFFLFFLAFFVLASVIQLWIFDSGQPTDVILVKTAASGLIASAVFVIFRKVMTRNK